MKVIFFITAASLILFTTITILILNKKSKKKKATRKRKSIKQKRKSKKLSVEKMAPEKKEVLQEECFEYIADKKYQPLRLSKEQLALAEPHGQIILDYCKQVCQLYGTAQAPAVHTFQEVLSYLKESGGSARFKSTRGNAPEWLAKCVIAQYRSHGEAAEIFHDYSVALNETLRVYSDNKAHC